MCFSESVHGAVLRVHGNATREPDEVTPGELVRETKIHGRRYSPKHVGHHRDPEQDDGAGN